MTQLETPAQTPQKHCKSCGQEGHCRSSAKKCPHYRPAKKARIAAADSEPVEASEPESELNAVELERTAAEVESDDIGSGSDEEETDEEEAIEADEEESAVEEPTEHVDEPSWKKNAAFLAKYLLRRDDPRAATHSSLVCGRYYIPSETRDEFYQKYYAEMLSAKVPSLFLTERYNEEDFRFFVDIDYEFEEQTVPKHTDTIAKIQQIFVDLCDTYAAANDLPPLSIPTIELFPCRAACRTDWKLHVIFYKTIVDWQSVLRIGGHVQNRLQQDRIKLDMKVYEKGSLRMLGSYKKFDTTPTHPNETESTYTPIDIHTGEPLEWTEKTLEEYSIFLTPRQKECLEESRRERAFVTSEFGTDFGTNPAMKAAIGPTQYTGSGIVSTGSPLYQCIKDNFGKIIASAAGRIIHNSETNHSTVDCSKTTYCPLAGKYHKGNHPFIVLSEFGMRLKCHSVNHEPCIKGGELIPRASLPEDVLSELPTVPIPEEYYKNPEQNAAFIRSFSGTDRDIAEFAQFDLRAAFVAVNTKNNDSTWWHYAKGRWNNASAGTLLFKALNRLPLVYEEVAGKTEDEKERKNLSTIALKCSDLTFLNKLIWRMCRLLEDTSFADKLDSKRHLLGFNDGVYDFEQMRFRPAVQTDYISMSVGYDFPKESDPVYRAKLDKFYADIQPDPIQRLYLKKVMATPLNTTSPRADFYVFSGNTRNGKSNLCDLESCTFGSVDTSLNDNDNANRYATVYSPTFLTKERKGGDSPAPDLLDFRLSRVMFGNEPANDAKIQTNTMKALTGRDTWSGRYLNENKIWKFKIYAIVFMNCNDRPSMSSNEPAVWFRTKVIDFPMKFVPNPTLPHELPEDIHLKHEIVHDIGWRKEHMLMLLEIYRDELLPNGLEPPESVLAATREYCDESNPLAQWWQENTEEAATHISTQALCNDFRSYDNDFRNISTKAFNKRLHLELGLTVRPSIRCVDKENPAVGIERRKLKDYGGFTEASVASGL